MTPLNAQSCDLGDNTFQEQNTSLAEFRAASLKIHVLDWGDLKNNFTVFIL